MPSLSKDKRQVSQIVVVVGRTGAGKTTFIDRATRRGGRNVGHGLQSCRTDIREVKVSHPTDAHPIVFVDTPGFDDPFSSDTEILSRIADWLVKTYEQKASLATILYLHRISDNRIAGSALKNIQMFSTLCGQGAMPKTILVTTMWSDVRKETAVRREQELQNDFWAEMLANGCRMERFEDSFESAWRIIGSLVPGDIVDAHRQLIETRPSKLRKALRKLISDGKDFGRWRSSMTVG